MYDLKVNDRVAVRGGYMQRDRILIRRVTRVLKRYVELDDGQKFTFEGSVYPSTAYSTSCLAPLTPKLEAEARLQRHIRMLKNTMWENLDAETLVTVLELVQASWRPKTSEGGMLKFPGV